MSESNKKPTLDNLAADPEDDLDDLDDVLSQFNPAQPTITSPITPSPPPPTANTTSTFGFSGRQRNNTRVDERPKSIPGSSRAVALDPANEEEEDALTADFAKELAMGMESLMREIAGEGPASVGAGGGGGSESSSKAVGTESMEEEQARVFKAAWEAMLVEGMDGNLGPGGFENLGGEASGLGKASALAAEEGSGTKAAGPPGFQGKIKQAMDKLKESESKIQGDKAGTSRGPGGNPDSLEALLQSLGDLGLDPNNPGTEGEQQELAGFLESMMSQLMSKDVLYEPLKELSESFPPYLANPPNPLSEEERKRYESQFVCVKKIVAAFEKEGYKDDNVEMNRQIVDLMSEMQSFGSPPSEIMGPLPAGLEGAGIPGLNEGDCTIA